MENTYTKQDFQKELREITDALFEKAKKFGIFPNEAEEEQKRKEEADRLEKTTETYMSVINEVDETKEKIAQLKANGYELKFSTERDSSYNNNEIIIKVSSENPNDLTANDISSIFDIMEKFISYHINYNQLKNIYKGHTFADNLYLESMFEYVAVQEYYRKSRYIQLKDIKKLMLMSGVYMYQIGLDCAEGRIKRVLRRFKSFLITGWRNVLKTS